MRLPCFPAPPETEFRRVYVNKHAPAGGGETAFSVVEDHKYYANNIVLTSKYTWWNFVPKNLFEQFRRIANFYFLIIVIVQFAISDRSPVSPATSLLPLAFVIFITSVKQGFEDWRRHSADKEVNNRPAVVLQDGREKEVYSKDLQVGDIVKVQNHEEIPCDLVVISSSDEKGKCHIMTANLDGETNLKLRESLNETAHLTSADQLCSLSGVIECDHPEYDMYKFNGRMHLYESNAMNKNTYALSLTNLLLRGSKLKNTDYAFGVAVYTGKETKMAKNQKSKTHKFSTVERSMNTFLLLFLLVLLVLTVICTILKSQREDANPWYIPEPKKLDAKEVVVTIFSFLVLFNYIIPISLYVTIEVQKFCGAMFFNWDVELYHQATNEPAIANTSDLNEELGQIEYVFSDKTGTLTENDMQFRRCSIGGVKYIEVDNKLCKDEASDDEPLDGKNISSEVKQFLLALALCHTVQADEIPQSDLNAYGIRRYNYQASSPDEKALCEAAARYGVIYKGKNGDFLELEVSGKDESYKLLHILDFDTTRKRMSVIVENAEKKIFMFCKGADSHVVPLCTSGSEVTRRETRLHIDGYAKVGLRTLTICYRELSTTEYATVDSKLSEAQQAIGDREEQLANVFDDVEKNFFLLGATAVEDKLQEKVKETMESLREAGIKIWVLTGDKLETAVNISSACGHFKNNASNVFYVTSANSSEDIQEKLEGFRTRLLGDPHGDYALVVDGSSLAKILVGEGKLDENFLDVGLKCQAVLCCRMSPLQKAHVVRIVKRSKSKPITLAIGDGANDCSMIQEAHVGCGIMGKEGRQAVRCSDYAFHRFYYLRRILLVHGHYFYTRLSNTVQYFFYKNVSFMLPQFLYQLWNGYSTLSLYSSLFLTCYNIFFTSLPILFYGIFEKDTKAKILYENPALYQEMVHNKNLSWRQFFYWSISGIWHGLVLYFGTKELYGASSFSSELLDYGLYTYGTFMFTCIVILANLKMALLIHYWTWFMHVLVWGSILLYVVVVLIFCGFVWPWPWISIKMELDLDLYNVIYMLFDAAMFWLAIILILSISLLPDVILTVLSRYLIPTELHKAQEQFHDATWFSSSYRVEFCTNHRTAPEVDSENAHLEKLTYDAENH